MWIAIKKMDMQSFQKSVVKVHCQFYSKRNGILHLKVTYSLQNRNRNYFRKIGLLILFSRRIEFCRWMKNRLSNYLVSSVIDDTINLSVWRLQDDFQFFRNVSHLYLSVWQVGNHSEVIFLLTVVEGAMFDLWNCRLESSRRFQVFH